MIGKENYKYVCAEQLYGDSVYFVPELDKRGLEFRSYLHQPPNDKTGLGAEEFLMEEQVRLSV